MKKPKLILSFAMIVSIAFIFAQEETQSKKRVHLNEFYSQAGFINRSIFIGSLNDFELLAPQSILLNQDYSSYSANSFYYNHSTSVSHSGMVGVNFGNNSENIKKHNSTLRLGLSYISGYSLINTLFKTERNRYDTLTSSQTGRIIFKDSVKDETLRMGYFSEQIRFDGSVLFRLNSDGRWSFFTGVGFTAGISFNAFTVIEKISSSSTETKYEGGFTQRDNNYWSYKLNMESFRNKSNLGFSAYLPLGVDFRVGKKREFWRRVYLHYEMRPSIDVVSIPELKVITSSMVQYGFGLRFKW
jgi:hypothetical protein